MLKNKLSNVIVLTYLRLLSSICNYAYKNSKSHKPIIVDLSDINTNKKEIFLNKEE